MKHAIIALCAFSVLAVGILGAIQLVRARLILATLCFITAFILACLMEHLENTKDEDEET